MLTEKQVNEIREHLEKAQNPIFFFDNDQDGLCSFLLLQRYIGRGKGVAIKSFPELTKDYFRKVRELNSDYIFILDKPLVSVDFFNEARQMNIPIVYIDHHDYLNNVPEYVSYYNPRRDGGTINEATSLYCYQVSQKKEDMWLSVIGCVSDAYVPEFYKDFKEKYSDLVIVSGNVLDIYYSSEIGKVGQILGASLKDKTTNVVRMLKYMMKAKSPYEILDETKENYSMHKRFNEIDTKYKKILNKAINIARSCEGIIFFDYGGELSISSELANGLRQKFPQRTIVVGYIAGAKVNISIRGKKVKNPTLRTIKDFEGATGGGHEDAVGAKINLKDWDEFKERFRKNMKI